MARVLLLLPTTSYRGEAFREAARRLGVEVRVGSDRCHRLAEQWGEPLALRFSDPAGAVPAIVAQAAREPYDAVIGTDDRSCEVASLAARALGLAANPPEAARRARNKAAMRECFEAAGVPSPPFRVLPLDAPPGDFEAAARAVGWPVVVKPLLLSGSRGVIRADDPRALAEAVGRSRRIAIAADRPPGPDPAARRLLVERYLPGVEVALEALIGEGRFRTLALFDKPDPLEGPFFEETIYVTPSRLPRATRERIEAAGERAARALGLERGPVHAELRVDGESVHVVEVAGRSIGGLCSRTLRFGTGRSLEELVLSEALGRPLRAAERTAEAAGVLMIPIPRRGILRAVRGVERARAVAGIEDVEIAAPLDHEVVPPPEGGSYLGFAFARGGSPEQVEGALRAALGALEIEIAPRLVMEGAGR